MDRPDIVDLEAAVLRVAEFAREAARIEQARRRSPPQSSPLAHLRRMMRWIFGRDELTTSKAQPLAGGHDLGARSTAHYSSRLEQLQTSHPK